MAADTKSNGGSNNGQSKKKSILQSIFSLSTLSSLAALFYVWFAFSNLLNLMYPLRNIPKDTLASYTKDKMVYPYWASGSNEDELGLRVYLSSKPDFSLDYFKENDKFSTISDNDGSENVAEEEDDVIRKGNSFLLWSEDNALDATKTFPSRSFVLVANDDPSSTATTCSSTNDDTQTCSNEQESAQKSIQFAHKWLEDSIKHEKDLASDGGGIMAAMNSAGGGIESTSVLLTLYTSLSRNLKSLLDTIIHTISGGGESSSDDATQSSSKQDGDAEEPKTIIHISPNNPLWKSLKSNGAAYVHVVLVRQTPTTNTEMTKLISSSKTPQSAAKNIQQRHAEHNVLFGKVQMIKQEVPLHVESPKRFLYRDALFVLKKYIMCPIKDDGACTNLIPPWNVQHHQTQAHQEYQQAQHDKKEGIKYPYWKPEVMIHLIQDEEGYPVDYHNQVGFDIIQVRGRGKQYDSRHPSGYSYLPAVHVDEIGLTSDKYIPLNKTVEALPLRIGFHSGSMMTNHDDKDTSQSTQQGLTPARYRLLNHLSSSLESQREMGFEQSDIDDIRRLIAETNVILLAITMLASVLHLLFEFLTFKSDVNFWKENTDLTGLSVRALFLDWISQVVILLYLIQMDSSLLMTVPSGFGMLIALWKCQRGAGIKFVKCTADDGNSKAWYNRIFSVFGYELCATRLRAAKQASSDKPSKAQSRKAELARLTEETDQLATRLLGKYFLLPLVISYAVYSLVKELHSGWYSWFITTASSFVYAVGFVLMTPQLFLNYKLKSVAHLPWRVLGYKFVNTFIDDLFAFIIRMPTMARMSCFRDDIVFIIYLYQRWLYPVDTSRPVEGVAAQGEDNASDGEKKEKKQ